MVCVTLALAERQDPGDAEQQPVNVDAEQVTSKIDLPKSSHPD
jgi:hypothetical protein